MRIGPAQVLEKETDQLYDWVDNIGQGVMGLSHDYCPDECLEFVVTQYQRFNLDFPSEIFDVARVGARAAFYCVDTFDPYSLFWGVSDVDLTDDWTKYTYEIHDKHTRIECPAEEIETYKFMPGQCETVFSEYITKYGVQNLPNNAGMAIDELLWDSCGQEVWDGLDVNTETSFRALITKNGVMDEGLRNAYFDIAAWAAYLWIIGPMGREFRMRHHPIMDVAVRFGECILYQGNVFSPDSYTKHARAPRSCSRCGIDAWCTEMTMDGDIATYICEACATQGMPICPPSNCGSKFCRFAECPRHPYHSTAVGSGYNYTRHHGQLVGVVQRNLVLGNNQPKLLN